MKSEEGQHSFRNKIASQVEAGDWKSIETHFNSSPFTRHMGLSISLDDPSTPKCMIIDAQPFQTGGVGQDFVNGAIIAAMFDFTIGLTALPYASQGNFATTNVNVKFIKPVEQNGVYVTATCTRKIDKKLFVEATLFNRRNDACCHANGEIRVAIG